MADVKDLTMAELQRAIQIKQNIEQLQAELDSLGNSASVTASERTRGRRRMPASAIAKIRAAQKARWAKIRGETGAAITAEKPAKKRKMSAATKAKMAAAAKARWATVKAQGKKTL